MDESYPEMPWAEIAASAYRAYAASLNYYNARSEAIATWEELSAASRTAWEAAVRQVGFCFENSGELNEQRWQGWLPPEISIHHQT